MVRTFWWLATWSMAAMFVYLCVCVTGSQLIWKHEGVFFVRERMKREKKGGGGWKADRRGLGRSAIFQQARHTTWSLITHKALCNSNHRLGCIIRLNKTWPSLSFTPLSLPCCYKTFASGCDISMPLLINWTNCTCCCFHCRTPEHDVHEMINGDTNFNSFFELLSTWFFFFFFFVNRYFNKRGNHSLVEFIQSVTTFKTTSLLYKNALYLIHLL